MRPTLSLESTTCAHARGATRVCFLVLAALVAGLMSWVADAPAQSVDSTLWTTDAGGTGLTFARSGDTLYVGGAFRSLGMASGGGSSVDVGSGGRLNCSSRIVGTIYSAVSDGSGGLYVGGKFAYIGSKKISNLAHLDMNGEPTAWFPDPDGAVHAIVLLGDTVFVGGDFLDIGGQPRGYLAALSAETGQALDWKSDADGSVRAIAARGVDIYVGGWFSTLGVSSRPYVGAIDRRTAIVSQWAPQLDDRVTSLACTDSSVFIGGYFRAVNALPRTAVAAVDPDSGGTLPWDARLSRTPISFSDGGPHVNALLIADASVYLAGSFTESGATRVCGLSRLQLSTGAIVGPIITAHYSRDIGSEFWAIEEQDDTLFVAGLFDSVAGAAREYVAKIEPGGTLASAWDPRPNDEVYVLRRDAGLLFLGGRYTSLRDWVVRHGLGAIDLRTGVATSWAPEPDAIPRKLLAWNRRVFVGGDFLFVGGAARQYLAELDPVSGSALPWDPNPDAPIWTMASSASGLIVAGRFFTFGGLPQRGIALVSPNTGALLPWVSSVGGDVYALSIVGTSVYFGGDFTDVGGQARNNLANIDVATGEVGGWAPSTDGAVFAMAPTLRGLAVGGLFSAASTVSRQNLAEIDMRGIATSWAPDPDDRVEAICTSDSLLFVGGWFTSIGRRPQPYLAVFTQTGYAAQDGFPTPDDSVWGLESTGSLLFVGGKFSRLGRWPATSIAALWPRRPSSVATTSIHEVKVVPNPAAAGLLLLGALPENSEVVVELTDVQGRLARRTTTVSRRCGVADGEVEFSVAGLRPGQYFLSLKTNTTTLRGRCTVVR